MDMFIWVRRMAGFDRKAALFEVGLVDDAKRRGSALLFVDIRSTEITGAMVAKMDSGTAGIHYLLWHRILACGHSRIVYCRLSDRDDLEARRRAVAIEKEGVVSSSSAADTLS